MSKLSLYLIIAVLIKLSYAQFTDCGQETAELTSISVTGCDSDECHFKIGTNVTVNAKFLSKTQSDTVNVKVWGVISGIPVPFPIKPSDACGNWNIVCPISNGTNYDLILSLPILNKYPRIELQVRIALIDSSSKKLICQQFPVEIEA